MRTVICKESQHEICWDGRTVWVNSGYTSSSLARFSRVHAEVHMDVDKQHETGKSCLDCFNDTSLEGWKRFQASVHKHYGAVVPDEARPEYLRAPPKTIRVLPNRPNATSSTVVFDGPKQGNRVVVELTPPVPFREVGIVLRECLELYEKENGKR